MWYMDFLKLLLYYQLAKVICYDRGVQEYFIVQFYKLSLNLGNQRKLNLYQNSRIMIIYQQICLLDIILSIQMFNYHYTESHAAKPAIPPQPAKETMTRSSYQQQSTTKKQNNLQVTNRIIQTHYHEPIYVKTGKPLRVVLPNHFQNSEKRLLESSSIDTFLAQKNENSHLQQKEHAATMGSKIRQKINGQMEEGSCGKEESNAASTSISVFSFSFDQQKFVQFKQWVTAQISKMNHKIKIQDETLQKFGKLSSEMEQKEAFTGHQIEDLNRILSLVEKAGNREDYKRTNRMIDELRENILQLHQQLSDLSQKSYKQSLNKTQSAQSNIKEMEVQTSLANLKKIMQECKKQQQNLIETLETFENVKKDAQAMAGEQFKISAKQFKGKMVSFKYQQKLELKVDKNGPQSVQAEEMEAQEMQQGQIRLTSRLYYIDNQGYLLDSDGFYLTNRNQQQIRLTNQEIQILKANKLL